MNKEQIIDSLVGHGVGLPLTSIQRATELGLVRFTGNQWNEEWQWNREALAECSAEDLQRLYEHLKEKP